MLSDFTCFPLFSPVFCLYFACFHKRGRVFSRLFSRLTYLTRFLRHFRVLKSLAAFFDLPVFIAELARAGSHLQKKRAGLWPAQLNFPGGRYSGGL